MLSYKDFTRYFGISLYDAGFQDFLLKNFSDLSKYDITHSDYITSGKEGIELGFNNRAAVYDEDDYMLADKGNPIFSHFNIYPKPSPLVVHLPLDVSFTDKRPAIISKAGQPARTNKGYADFLDKNFLIDHYKAGDLAISFDYNPDNQKLNFIQVRDNNTVEEHIKL